MGEGPILGVVNFLVTREAQIGTRIKLKKLIKMTWNIKNAWEVVLSFSTFVYFMREDRFLCYGEWPRGLGCCTTLSFTMKLVI